MKALWSFAK